MTNTHRPRMTKEEMEFGFARKRSLIQEEWAHPLEIQWVDDLVAEGRAIATPWKYKDNFQCKRRRVTGLGLPFLRETS